MRYLFGFVCVCALGVVPLVGCVETQPECERAADCDDQNDCTDDTCDPASGTCSHTPSADGTSCDFGGAPGVCMSGACEEDLCDGIDCSDENACTEDVCEPADATCSNRPVEDDTACDFSGFPGLCKAGVCEDAMLCEGVTCEDTECKIEGVCDANDGMCDYTSIEDGSPCGGETYWGNPRGGCYAGSCNFRPVSVAVGAKEIVFDWSTDRCEEFDIPDGPAKAVRASDGEIVLFGTIHETGNYLSRGNDFDSLEHDCEHPALRSANLPTPESYENNEWLWSPYRVGASWHVLIHNEFHDAVSINCSPSYLCWYNSITYAVSTDSARTFVKPSPPAHVVAPAPRVWTPPDTPVQDWYAEGYFGPSNIVRGPDDYYYTLIEVIPHARQARGACVMRTKTLDDPASWRAWDGGGFNLPLTSPYVSGAEVPACKIVTQEGEMQSTGSLTYNTYLDRYMWVGMHLSWETGESVCGVYFSTSFDLIHWSDIQLIAKALSWCETDPTKPGLLEVVQIQYPSIVDHEDSTANFERPGRFPYLYYTRHNGGYWLDRDLVRVPLTFTLEE